MVTRIEHLTPEQEAAIPAWVDKWIEHGLDTTPADRPKVEAGIGASSYTQAVQA